MKIISPSVQYMSKDGLTPYQFIEKIGRTCYKSTDKITDTSAEKFVLDLATRRHYAMLEHWWVHIIYDGDFGCLCRAISRLCNYTYGMSNGLDLMRFIQITFRGTDTYISAPLRVFLELDQAIEIPHDLGDTLDDLMSAVENEFPLLFNADRYSYRHPRHSMVVEEEQFITQLHSYVAPDNKPEIADHEVMKHKTHTLLFVCDRGVSHELVRHRPASFAQESTRYCNYQKGKFGSEITVIKPFFFNRDPNTADNVLYDDSTYSDWLLTCERAEKGYMTLIQKGATPQEARSVLPNSLKTEVIMTANEIEWQHVVDLRYRALTGAPHPQMKEVMTLAVPALYSCSDGRIFIG